MSARYAIYFSPRPGSALARFGQEWFTGHEAGRPLIEAASQARITATARHYGFHATLKAPFRLAPGCGPEDLRAALAAFASHRAAPRTPSLTLRRLDGFLALMLSEAAPEVDALAQACVETFEPFRAPLTDAELARRRAAPLSARQQANLERWGYPYVAEDFRFHMTLTARLEGAEAREVEAALGPVLAPLCQERLDLDAVALFHQPSTDQAFSLLERCPLAPSPRN